MIEFTDKQKQLLSEFSLRARGKSYFEIFELCRIYMPLFRKEGIDEGRAKGIIFEMLEDENTDEQTRGMISRIIEIMQN